MGFVIVTNTETGESEVLGDVEQYRKAQGLSYRKPDGRMVTSETLNEIDKMST